MNILVFILILSELTYSISCSKAFKISIGLVYCDDIDLTKAEEILTELNDEKNSNSKIKIKMELKPLQLKMDDNPISVSLSVCDKLMASNSLYGLIISSSECLPRKNSDPSLLEKEYLQTVSAISFTCSYYQIPVFDLVHRNAIFSDKSTYSSFIRMTTPYYHQASIWIELLKYFEWKSVNLIYSSDEEGKYLASRFQHLADQNEIKVIILIYCFLDIFSGK
jgi:hypothetical protein